ncbi:hypothetical protein KTO58_26035 [Chitinophaga pendula]|uniref:hypothetical protein n=1 Tax=Chitinophaga TaxID=79328 RepID=UPI0012FD8FBE|nr:MULTISPECIES: hypothetical protein [Chitinophaga]UCJ07088.1 hypothetical protein KTO58_26035 [Chitinophaga pendula]
MKNSTRILIVTVSLLCILSVSSTFASSRSYSNTSTTSIATSMVTPAGYYFHGRCRPVYRAYYGPAYYYRPYYYPQYYRPYYGPRGHVHISVHL